MTDEEKSKELTRSSFAAQMAMLGYEPNGNPKINRNTLPIVEGKCPPKYDPEKQEWFYPEPDPEDNPDPEGVMDGLRRLADNEILDESWREILTDEMKLIWLRYGN